jgi:uncharacterized membrane protein YhaH (DUF805 family)
MNFQQSVKTCMIKYIDFTGRASRSEYWWYQLFGLIICMIALTINHTLYSIVALLLFLPSLTVLVRRLHDTNRSAWWLLISLIPIIGAFILLYFVIIKGSNAPNDYGNPSF